MKTGYEHEILLLLLFLVIMWCTVKYAVHKEMMRGEPATMTPNNYVTPSQSPDMYNVNPSLRRNVVF